MTPDRNINSVPEEEQQSVIVAASAMDPVDLEEGLNQSMDNDEEPTETMEDEPIEGLEEEPIDVTQDDANVTMESGPVETMEDEPGDDEPSLAHINHSINTSVSSENCKIINESDQMHSPCPDPEGANIAVMNSGMDHEAVIPGTANLTPVKLLDPELKEQDTFTSSPTNSRDEHLVDDDEARPLSRRQQRMRVVKCYAMVAIVVLVCAIGIPLGAVMLFKNNNNETSFAGSTGSNNSPSTSTTTVKPDDMRPPETPAVIEDTDAPVVEDEDGSTDPPLFVEDDFETDIPLVNPVATDAPVMVESNTTDFVEEEDPLDEIEMNVTSETVPEVEVPVEEEDEVSTSSPTTSPSASPSAAATQRQTPPTTPGPDRSSIYFDLINVTSPAILQDTSTPQALSYLWMVEKDQFLPVPTGRYLIQRYILVVMDHVMHDPIGPGLSQPALDHCLWEGIVCEPETGDIKQINWRLQGLNGRLAEELKHLDSLERLDLSENSLVGNLEVLYDATFLKDVYLHNNRLTGPLTEQIGQLEELESLNLGHNQLTGNIPISLRSSRGEAKPLSKSFCPPFAHHSPVHTCF